MKSKKILYVFLFIMAAMIVSGILFYGELKSFFQKPALYRHALFVHILSVTLFFSNALIGILWELRSLATGRRDIIRHTYDTVSWIDARFSSPLIILSVLSGIVLSLMLGDIWKIGWLFFAFILFLLSGVLWVLTDIPTQYRIKSQMEQIDSPEETFPEDLIRLLKRRLIISLSGVFPLVVVFLLMVYKPEIHWLSNLFP